MPLGRLFPGSFSVAEPCAIDMAIEKSGICNSGIYVAGWPAVAVVYAVIAACNTGYELAVRVPSCACGISKLSNFRWFIDSGALQPAFPYILLGLGWGGVVGYRPAIKRSRIYTYGILISGRVGVYKRWAGEVADDTIVFSNSTKTN